MKNYTQHILIAEVTFPSGYSLSFPQLMPELLQFNRSPSDMAQLMEVAITKSWMEKGNYKELLSLSMEQQLEAQQLEVEIPASSEGLFPEMKLAFQLFYAQVREGQWIGFLPVPGIASSGNSYEELLENARENIGLEFVRNFRLRSVSSLLPSQWYQEVRLHRLPITYPVYTLSEVEKLQGAREQQLLKEITTLMKPVSGGLYGLDEELDQLITAMQSKGHNSVLIQAGAGKGKTEIVKQFLRKKHTYGLENLQVYQVTAGQLLHRLTGLGRWQDYLAELCRELREEGKALYLPNFSELFEVGQYSGNDLSIAEYLRPYIARGEITLISECTPEEAARIELRSPGYLGLLQVIKVKELDTPKLQDIVWRKARFLGRNHKVKLQEAAVREILRLQQWYTPYSGLPGKTIAFLEALAATGEEVDKGAVYQAFCQETGLPEFMVNPELPLTYEQMDRFFHANIYGQEEAIETLSELMFAIKAAVIKRGQPLASLLFVGPTGVGKTELAKVLASFLFGSRDRMLRFDMSEYADLGSVLRLTGDTRGGEGQLTAMVRQNPFSVLLFDELEKVHPSFYDLLLQILGEGRLTDARGRVADFCSTIIIMTSNIGARAFQMGSVGFGERPGERQDAAEHFRKAVQDHFRPELFNRLDRIVAFSPLDRKVIRQIVDRELGLLLQREGLQNRQVQLELAPEALDYLGEKGYNALYGARHLQRTLRELLLLPLAEKLNAFLFHVPLAGKVFMKDSQLHIEVGPLKSGTPILEMQVAGPGMKLQRFLDKVSRERRKGYRIMSGPVFNQNMSDLFALRRNLYFLKQKNKEASFWSNPEKSKNYHALSEMENDFNRILEEVELLEEENLLLLSDRGKDQIGLLWQRFQSWRQEFLELKMRLFSRHAPQYNSCTLGIYGPRLYAFELAKVYQGLGEALDWKVEIAKVWQMTKPPETIQETYPDMPKSDKDGYVRSSQMSGSPGAFFSFVGLELFVEGKMPFVYLEEEKGTHVYTDKTDLSHKYLLTLTPGKRDQHQAPDGLNRKQFFSQPEHRQGRRTYSVKEGMKDETYKIQCALKEVQEVLKKELDARFFANLDKHLLG